MLCTGCLLNTNTCIPAGNWFVSLHFGVTVQSDRFLGLSTSANALAPFMCAVLFCNILCSGFCFLLPKRKKRDHVGLWYSWVEGLRMPVSMIEKDIVGYQGDYIGCQRKRDLSLLCMQFLEIYDHCILSWSLCWDRVIFFCRYLTVFKKF